LVLSPQEALIAGGPAEELERRIQEVFKIGYEHVVIDLRGVPSADSAGVRALVRGHTSAQRLNRRFTLVSPNPKVKDLLELSLLTNVLEVVDTLVEAKARTIHWDRVWAAIAVTFVGAALVGAGMKWPGFGLAPTVAPEAIPGVTDSNGGSITLSNPLFELAKLVTSAMIGMLVTIVHRQYRTERSANPALDQAQVLLCVSGAIMMIIIGNSVARAFGIAGAASIIRFRTPVEDPKDVTILFLLMGLGMSSGLGAWAVAGLGTAFLCIALVALDHMSSQKARVMSVEIQASGREFPTTHVEGVFARNQIVWEPREISQSGDVTVKYHTWLDPRTSLEDLSSQLMSDGAAVQSVAWEHPKRER